MATVAKTSQRVYFKYPPCKHLHRLIQELNNFEMAIPDIEVTENIFCIIITKWKDL